MLDDWTNAGFDPFASPAETDKPFGVKDGVNTAAVTRRRVTASRMVGVPGDEQIRTDDNGIPINRMFADVAQDEPEVHAEPGFESEVAAFNLFALPQSRQRRHLEPVGRVSVCKDSLYCPTTEEYILPVIHGNDRVEWFVQLSDEILWDVEDRDTGAARAKVVMKAGDVAAMPADIRHQGYSPEAVDAARVGERLADASRADRVGAGTDRSRLRSEAGSVTAAFSSLADAIAAHVHDGDRWRSRGSPTSSRHAAGHEIIRQERRDLTLVRMTPDIAYDQMIGAGCASKLIFSWGGNPGVGSLHRFRDAVENGWPVPLAIEEHSHAGMATRYAAGASGLPVRHPAGLRRHDLPDHTATIAPIDVPVHRRGADRRPGAQSRRRHHPCPAGRPRRQRADLGARGRAEGSGARGAAVDRHRRGDRRRARAPPERRRAAVVGRRRGVPRCPAGRTRASRWATRARQRVLPRVGRRLARPRLVHGVDRQAREGHGRLRRVLPQRGHQPEERLVSEWSADDLMIVNAARQLCDDSVCFVGIGLPSTAANLARRLARARLRARSTSRAASARSRRGCRCRSATASWPRPPTPSCQRARDLRLLAAGRAHRRRLPRRGAARPLRQHQLDRDRRLRASRRRACPAPAARRRSRRRPGEVIVIVRQNGAHLRRALRLPYLGRASATARATGERLGLRGRGPQIVITDLGILRPDPETCELVHDRAPSRTSPPTRRSRRPAGRCDVAGDARGHRAPDGERARRARRAVAPHEAVHLRRARRVASCSRSAPVSRVGDEARRAWVRTRVFLIVDTQAKQFGDALAEDLGALVVSQWHEVVQHVPVELAERARAAVADAQADAVVCLGGGSSTGLAKAIALTHDLPILAVPTTYAGQRADADLRAHRRPPQADGP